MSFYITLYEAQNHFDGNLKAQFSKCFRLRGEWEVALVMHAVKTQRNVMAWVFCDVVD